MRIGFQWMSEMGRSVAFYNCLLNGRSQMARKVLSQRKFAYLRLQWWA